jgi:hypothetical protein
MRRLGCCGERRHVHLGGVGPAGAKNRGAVEEGQWGEAAADRAKPPGLEAAVNDVGVVNSE